MFTSPVLCLILNLGCSVIRKSLSLKSASKVFLLVSHVQRSVNSRIFLWDFFLFYGIVVCEAPELHRAMSGVDKSIAYLWVHGC